MSHRTDNKYGFDVGPFFDQEDADVAIIGMIESMNISQPYEIDECAVFKCRDKGYLVVWVSGCSCWPDRGGTRQEFCPTQSDVDRVLTGEYRSLLQKCQDAKWSVEIST